MNNTFHYELLLVNCNTANASIQCLPQIHNNWENKNTDIACILSLVFTVSYLFITRKDNICETLDCISKPDVLQWSYIFQHSFACSMYMLPIKQSTVEITRKNCTGSLTAPKFVNYFRTNCAKSYQTFFDENGKKSTT